MVSGIGGLRAPAFFTKTQIQMSRKKFDFGKFLPWAITLAILIFHTVQIIRLSDRQNEITETQIRNGHRIEQNRAGLETTVRAVNWMIPVTDHTLRIIKAQDTTVVYPNWAEFQKQKEVK